MKYGEEENEFHKWVKTDFNYNHTQFGTQDSIHNSLLLKLDDEQLDGSSFVFQEIKEIILEIYKINDIQASSNNELPPKFKNS